MSNNLLTCAISVFLYGTLLAGCMNLARTPASGMLSTVTQKNVLVNAELRSVTAEEVLVHNSQQMPAPAPQMVYAEPVPNALRSYGETLRTWWSFSQDATQPELSTWETQNEGSASVSVRGQTLTILRDELYRICEAYKIGAIDAVRFRTLYERNQASQRRLMEIERTPTAQGRAP